MDPATVGHVSITHNALPWLYELGSVTAELLAALMVLAAQLLLKALGYGVLIVGTWTSVYIIVRLIKSAL